MRPAFSPSVFDLTAWSYCAQRQRAVREHRAQHLVAAVERCLRVVERVVDRTAPAADRRASPTASSVSCDRVLREVGLRGRLDAVGVVAVVDGVQVLVEDLRLRPLARELDRETRLFQLALERLLLADVEVADELLRDRRAALDDLAGRHVLPRGARDALVVDAAVLVEAAVLDRDGRARQPLRHLAVRDRLAVALGRDRAEQRSRRARRRTSSGRSRPGGACSGCSSARARRPPRDRR